MCRPMRAFAWVLGTVLGAAAFMIVFLWATMEAVGGVWGPVP